MKITELQLRKIIRSIINESMDPNDIMPADASSHGRFFDKEIQKSSLIDTLEKQYTDPSQLKKVILMLPMKQRLLEAGIMGVINSINNQHESHKDLHVGTRLWLLMFHPKITKKDWSACKELQDYIESKCKNCMSDINKIRDYNKSFGSLYSRG